MNYDRFNDERLRLGKPPISRYEFDRRVREGRATGPSFDEESFFSILLVAELTEAVLDVSGDALVGIAEGVGDILGGIFDL